MCLSYLQINAILYKGFGHLWILISVGVLEQISHGYQGKIIIHSFQRAAAAKSLQSCPTQSDLIDGSPPGSPVPGILQARTLEWISKGYMLSNQIYTNLMVLEWRRKGNPLQYSCLGNRKDRGAW